MDPVPQAQARIHVLQHERRESIALAKRNAHLLELGALFRVIIQAEVLLKLGDLHPLEPPDLIRLIVDAVLVGEVEDVTPTGDGR